MTSRMGLSKFIAIVAAFGCVQAMAGQGTSIAQSVLKVHASSPNGVLASGSAVAIGTGRAITACHVTQHANKVELTQDGKVYSVTAQIADVEHDLCLLEVAGLDRPQVKVATANALQLGQNVFAVGFAFGGKPHVVTGEVERLYDYDAGKVIQTTARFYPGDSGGGLFNESGELVGVLAFMLGDEGARHFAVPVDWFVAKLGLSQEFLTLAPIAERQPFWVGRLERLPHFLQAVAHEVNEDWEALLDVTDRWRNAEPSNAEAFSLQGKALAALGRTAVNEIGVKGN